MYPWWHGHPPLMCYEQWALNTDGIRCHRVDRSQETRGTTVLSHMYPVSFFFVNVVHGKEKSQWNRGGFVMLLYSSSFSKLSITFSTVNFLSAEQDTILKHFWIGGQLISLPSVWAGHWSLLVVFHFHSSASMSDDLTSQPKKFLVLVDQVLVTGHDHDPLHWSIPQHVQALSWLVSLGNRSSQLLHRDPF